MLHVNPKVRGQHPRRLERRAAEGIDAVRNLAHSGMGNTTGIERGATIVCGLSQLGGLIFSAILPLP
eukprot:4221526-Prymnesium_polylepis.1